SPSRSGSMTTSQTVSIGAAISIDSETTSPIAALLLGKGTLDGDVERLRLDVEQRGAARVGDAGVVAEPEAELGCDGGRGRGDALRPRRRAPRGFGCVP